MASTNINVISLSESERLKSLLKHPEDDLKEIISLIEQKIEKSTRDLKESEEKFRNITDHSLMGICIVQDDVIKYANQRMSDINGYSLEEIMNWQPKEFYKTIVSESLDFASEQAKKKQLGLQGTIPQYPMQIIKKSGEKIWIENFSKTINFNRKPADLVTFFDITKQKKVEEAFLREKKFTDTTLNAQRDTFFVFEPSTGKAVRWNNAFKEASGYSDDEIRELKAPEGYYREEDLNQLVGSTELIEQGGTAINELSLITKEKNLIPFEYAASGIFTDEGNLKYIVAVGRDITERKKVQDILKENEQSLKEAQLIAHIGLFKLDPTTLEVSGSDELFKIFDLNQDEATLDAFANVVHPDDREYDLFHIKRGMETGESWNIEHRLICKNGTEKWVHAMGEASKDETGKIVMLIGTVQDITDRKKVEEVLYHERDLIRTLLENHPDFIYFKDKKARFQNLSKHFSELFGIKEEEIIGKTDLDLFPEELAKQTHSEDLHVISTGMPLINKEEESEGTWVLTTKLPWYDKDGKIKGLFGISRDITDRKKVEQELKESEERYRGLINNITDIIYELDINGKCTYVSNQLFEISGFRPEKMIGQNMFQYLHPEDFSNIIEKVKEAFNKEIRVSADFRLRHNNGHYVPVSSNFNVIRINDEKRFIGVLNDNTEKREAELKLRESEEKYRDLVNNIHDSIFELDENGILEYISPQIYEFTGYKPEEQIGLKIVDLIHPDDLESVLNSFKKVLTLGEVQSAEYRRKHKDGHYVYVISSGRRVKIGDKYKIVGTTQDITERKKAEQELKESEENFRTIAEDSHLAITILQDDLVVYTNQRMADMFGYEREEMLTWTPKEYTKTVAEVSLEFIMEQARKKQIGEPDVITQYPIHCVKSSGEKFWVDNISTTIIYNGRPADLITIIDTTDKREAEEKLKESEEKYRNLFEKSPNAIALLDFTGKIIDCNLATEKTFGYSIEDLKGRNYLELPFYSERMINKLKERFQTITKGFEIEPQELEIEKKDGNIVRIKTAISYFKIGEQYYFQAIIQDITEQKHAEQKLKESEEKFRTITEQSLIGIAILQNDIFEYVNQQIADIFGYTIEEMMRWPSLKFQITVHPDDRDFVLEQVRKKQLGLEDYLRQYQFRGVKKTGEIIWIDNFTQSITYEGKPADLVTFVDITKTKKAEQELMKLDQMKTDLIRRTSHELKTPLVAIKGFSDLLLELHSDKLEVFVVDTITEIKQGCSRLETLISDILKTAELEFGSVQLQKTEESLSFLINLCITELRGFSELRKHVINMKLHDNLVVYFEKEQIHQVLSNILSNAIKYTPPYGKIEIKTKLTGEYIIVSIRDNGIGLTKAEQSLLFTQFGKIERFGQGYDIISEGSGLGLYISKKIIELHGGKIWVESEGRNRGAKFFFSLPIIKS